MRYMCGILAASPRIICRLIYAERLMLDVYDVHGRTARNRINQKLQSACTFVDFIEARALCARARDESN